MAVPAAAEPVSPAFGRAFCAFAHFNGYFLCILLFFVKYAILLDNAPGNLI